MTKLRSRHLSFWIPSGTRLSLTMPAAELPKPLIIVDNIGFHRVSFIFHSKQWATDCDICFVLFK
jgi:hypothetical protein